MLKQWQNIFHVIVNANSIAKHVIQIKNGIMKHVNMNVKNYRACKWHYSWNPSTCICANSKYLKSKVDDSKILCDEIIYLKCILSTKKRNIIGTNVTSIASINSHSKK